ncbi:MAG: Stage V sporulation protein E [Berkelbacteria bacterium GW2011_GWA2_35_9]|uniref:Probable peptidoglycan glycosyltransferase FtsW n=1 Tax=Berkelbacteria bacterium GW2011_GWA2_35_9 TaxID=1618333 RepID=A0A0G0D3V8_9BACT|nr:MAG: Stage V sporulation protein E [Berkelbacteria bacterium GW2011_GWA2_35_9]
MSRLNKYRNRLGRKGDFWIFILAMGLALIGLMMILSSSVVISYERFNNNYYYVTQQIYWLFLAVILFIVVSNLNYKFWQKNAFMIFMISIVLLLLVYVKGLGVHLSGAQRWLQLGPISIQPSEIVKLTFIIYISAWLDSKSKLIHNFSEGILPLALTLLFVIFLIIKQPDMGTVLVISVIAGIIFYISEASIKYIISALFIGFMIFFLLIKISPYRMERLITYLNPESDTLGSGYQINQSLLAIGSGGLWGLGFGNSKQKYLYLPQPHSDAIFAIMVEELGFVRVVGVLLLFLILILRLVKICLTVDDPFARFMITGFTAWVAFQTLVNVAAIVGLVPLTGIPLPFISAGGSSLVMLFVGLAIVNNISKYNSRA